MAPLPEIDVPWMLDLLLRLLRTPSPAGRTDAVVQLLGDELADLPVELALTRRGSLLARLPGEKEGARAVVAHADTIGCMVRDLSYRLDINTLHRDDDAGRLAMNDIGRVTLRTTAPLFFDEYRRNRHTGSFILIDEATNETVAGGMILGEASTIP